MKSINRISEKIKLIKKIYATRISKLHEKRNSEVKFKIKKMASMASRGKDISSAGDRLMKFLEQNDNREKHHLKMKEKRIKELKEKQALLFIKEKNKEEKKLEKEQIHQKKKEERKMERERIKTEKNNLIEINKNRWRGKKYKKERNQLLLKLYKRPQRAKIRSIAHKGKAIDYFIENNTNSINPVEFLESCKKEFFRIMIPKHVPSKTNLKLECIFVRKNENKEHQQIISTRMVMVPYGSDLISEWEYFFNDLIRKLHNFMREKSGWRIKRIEGLIISTNFFKPTPGGTFIEIPKNLAAKKALINIKNKDQECFKWAITRSLFEPTTNLKKTRQSDKRT